MPFEKKKTTMDVGFDTRMDFVQSDKYQSLLDVDSIDLKAEITNPNSLGLRIATAFEMGIKAGREIERFANINAIEKLFENNSR